MLGMHLSRGRRGSGSLGLPEDWTDNDEAERFMRAAARQGHMGARRWLEVGAPRLPIAKWLYIRGWYKGKIPGASVLFK